jgi:hypothetical protein
MVDLLCSFIRETGVSDSGAAARASVHPSTVSRWKRDCPDLAILLRAAREDFRQVQLEVIEREAQAGRATSWRAAAWFLERVFPEDYAPRARERARFQERYEARCAAEVGEEGETGGQGEGEMGGAARDGGEALQNVRKSTEAPARLGGGQPEAGAAEERETGRQGEGEMGGKALHRAEVLQNVQKSPAWEPAARARATAGAEPAVEMTLDEARRADWAGFRFPERPLQNVQKSPLAGPMQPPRAKAASQGGNDHGWHR